MAGESAGRTGGSPATLDRGGVGAALVVDDGGRVVDANPAACELLGLPVEDPSSGSLAEHLVDGDFSWAAVRESSSEEITVSLRLADGTQRSVEFVVSSVSGGHILVARGATNPERPERALTTLHDAVQELLGTESRTAVAESVVHASTNLPAVSVTAVYFFEASAGLLTPVAVGGDAVDESATNLDPVALDRDSVAGRAFLDGERTSVGASGADIDGLPISGAVAVPVGEHGVCVVGEETFHAGVDGELVGTLAATAATALDRIESDTELRERAATFEEQTQQFERLRLLATTVREFNRTNVRAETRTDVERAVCRHLSTVEGVALVRVSGYDSGEECLVARECAGGARADGYLDTVSLAVGENTEPAARAVATEAPVHVANVAEGLHEEPWRKAALSHGLRSAFGLPLAHRNVFYGALTLYTERAALFGELSRFALVALSYRLTAVVNALEHRNAVLSGRCRELTVRFTDERIPLYRVATRADCSLTLGPVTPQPGGELTVSARVEDGDPAVVAETVTELTAVSGASPGADPGTVEFCLSSRSLVGYLADRGVRVLDSAIDPGSASFTLSVPDTVDIRTLFERLRARYDGPELVGKTEQTQTGPRVDEHLRSELTPRQQEVLRAAHDSGFFESPRACTGEDIAEELGVSAQTVYRHIRTAERTLFDIVFDTHGE